MLRKIAIAFMLLGVHSHSLAMDLDRIEKPPADWTGPVFVPNFNFPAALPTETRPWEAISYEIEGDRYLRSVLSYVLEGQDLKTLKTQNNTVRQWFHVPWMGPGTSGREFISGLTRERTSRKNDLGPGQTKCRQNWAVGFYNPVGGYALGQMWSPVAQDKGEPNLSAVPFPVGTVVAKFLFSEATADEVPLLRGAPTIAANINLDPNPNDEECAAATQPRKPAELRLLQLDVAVRDPRANSTTGWIFGTFVYDGRLNGTDPWAKLRPAGLMWGNDPTLTPELYAAGKLPMQGVFFDSFGLGRTFGRSGRANGPIDNTASACLSCHMTAQWPNPAPLAPPGDAPWAVASCWFRNLGPTAPFGAAPATGTPCGDGAAQLKSLDFSLQLPLALRNYYLAIGAQNGPQLFQNVVGDAQAVTIPMEDRPLMFRGILSQPVHR